MKKFKYMRNILKWDGKCDTEIRRLIWIVKAAFHILSKILRNR